MNNRTELEAVKLGNTYAALAGESSGSIVIRNEGGYVAKFRVDYLLNGERLEAESGSFTLGVSTDIQIPAGASDINLCVKEAIFINTWSTIFTENFAEPGHYEYEISGTTLNPSWKKIENR